MNHKLIHDLLKYLRGQKSFPKKQIKKIAKMSTDLSTKKIKRYKTGKFSNASFEEKVYHLIEELNEYIQNPSKEERRDVIVQCRVLL